MLLVLLGKTCSGKTVLADYLCNFYHFSKVVTYTSRPKRLNEIDHKDYHFITEQEFMDKVEENFFFEYKSYTVADGSTWYYGSALPEDVKDNLYVIILTPSGLNDLRNANIPHVSCYLSVDDGLLRNRLVLRGDDETEAVRRLEHDNEDFKDLETDIVLNNSNRTLSEVCSELIGTLIDW